jgi:hypothetical protein
MLGITDLEPLLAKDYRDGVHVVPDAGVRFARRIISRLEQSEGRLMRGTAGFLDPQF